MNERERNKLLGQLHLLEFDLEDELQKLRSAFRLAGDSSPDRPICKEIEFLATYVDRFTSGAIELAKTASRHPQALEMARARCRELRNRFDPHVATYRSMLERQGGSKSDLFENGRVLRLYRTAVRRGEKLLEGAQLDFDELPAGKRPSPTVSTVDEWIRQCAATNSKDAWDLIKNQREFIRPTHKVFYERWRALRPASRGRPKKTKR